MKTIADLHIHSKYAYATSRFMDLDDIARWAKVKGVGLLASSDFTHPLWMAELKSKLRPVDAGTFAYKGITFILGVEVSNIYKRNGRTYKIHNLVFVPGFTEADLLIRQFRNYGILTSDGRPILKLDSEDLVKMVKDAGEECYVIPSHAWTPHFGLFGSRSGFDSMEECFGSQTKEIFAIETGLSSDPAMNWRLSALDRITLISNSDAHSSPNIGREANVFDLGGKVSTYREIFEILRTKDKKRFLFTIEFFPEEGKYHYDGHRQCNVRLTPKESSKRKDICPVCGKPLTVGVLHRVEDLADRPDGIVPPHAIPFKKLLSLEQVLANAFGKGKKTVVVEKEYLRLIKEFGNELNVLLDVPVKDLRRHATELVSDSIMKMREGKVDILPGFDGEYGEVNLR
jgi:uncharacterized protein (TIGR00375 family)